MSTEENTYRQNTTCHQSTYRFSFNGKEKDDEVYGAGNLTTAMFWEYDTRLGRRWNVDPVVKPFESPYAVFRGNPLLFIDSDGNDGEPVIDQQAKSINVKITVYYWSDIFGDLTKQSQVVNNIQNENSSRGFQQTFLVDISDNNASDMWTITYNVNFSPISASSQDAYEQKAKSNIAQNPTHNYLETWGNSNKGGYGKNKISIGSLCANNWTKPGLFPTFYHELGHAIGLPHDKDIAGTPSYGDLLNGGEELYGGIMSYANYKKVLLTEVKHNANQILDVVRNSNITDRYVKVHMQGEGDPEASTVIESNDTTSY